MYSIINNLNIEFEYEEDIEIVLNKMVDEYELEEAIFNVIIIDNNEIKKINKEYRGKDAVTDVISFAFEDTKDIEMPIRVLGDIYISLEKAKEQAILYGHSLKRELSFLTIHGMLHLLGYDHMNKEEEEIMFRIQNNILSDLKIERGI